MSDKTHACVMPLPNKAVEYNELNLVENTKNKSTTTIFTTHLPTEERQIEYSTVIKAEKKESNQKPEMMQLEGIFLGENT